MGCKILDKLRTVKCVGINRSFLLASFLSTRSSTNKKRTRKKDNTALATKANKPATNPTKILKYHRIPCNQHPPPSYMRLCKVSKYLRDCYFATKYFSIQCKQQLQCLCSHSKFCFFYLLLSLRRTALAT